MIERTINKVLKSISNLPAEYKIALIRILTGIVENIITLDKGKVDKEQGKSLSTNDFTDELKNKLNNIENGAQKNVKSDWNAITGDSIILNKPSLNGYPDSAIWDEQNKNIIFKHQETILPQMTISGANFIKDGMVDNVQIQDNNLVITFNTDAGKSPFSIPLTNIFNPNNYYNKTQTDNKFVEKVAGKQLSTEDFTTDLKTRLENIGDANLITSITYNELKTLRDNNRLSPGMQYRITDYQCTTTQTDTQSAGNQFDIIVVADDVNKFNENARAVQHSGDTYFANSKLEAWKLKYSLDNDTTRFAWADSTNGKGVIYWMKDEYDNECPYDFKNIQFKRWAITDIINSNMESVALNGLKNTLLYASGHEHCFSFKSSNITINRATVVVNSNNYKWYYTFGETDGSLLKGVRDNKISYFSDTTIIKSLPNIVFINTSTNVVGCYKNILNNCNNSTFDYNFTHNIVNYSYNNIISYNYEYNKMYNSNDNIINRDCYNNIFDTINNNFISNNCQNNIVKNFRLNNIGYSFQFNICENNFYSNNIGNTCNNNIFKTNFSNSTIKSSCNYNVFGICCSNIILESNCQYNIFENHCSYIYMGKSYMEHIIVESGNMNMTITSTQTTSGVNTLQNFKIAQGVNNSGITKTISHDTVNDAFQTIYKATGSTEIEV